MSEAGERTGASAGRLAVFFEGDDAQFAPLTALFGDSAPARLATREALAEHVGASGDHRAIVFYRNPSSVIAERIRAGESPSDALSAWSGQAERLLAVFRRRRGQLTLVDAGAARRHGGRFAAMLSERLGLPVPGVGAERDDEAPAQGGLEHLLAAEVLRAHPVAGLLVEELEASSLPLGRAWRVDADAIAERLPRDEVAQSQPPAAATEENELLRLQMRQLQQELEAHILDNSGLRQRIEELREESAQRQQRIDATRMASRQELDEMRQDLERQRREAAEKLKWATADLANIRQSLSWRLTAPLRKIIGFFIGGTRL